MLVFLLAVDQAVHYVGDLCSDHGAHVCAGLKAAAGSCQLIHSCLTLSHILFSSWPPLSVTFTPKGNQGRGFSILGG